MKEQKQGGLIQSTELLKENPLPSHLVAQNVAKQTLSIFMLTAMAEELTNFVVNATKKLATKDGIRGHGWIGGLLGGQNMASPKSTLCSFTKTNKANVQFVWKSQKQRGLCMWIIVTQQVKYVGCYVMVAIQALAQCVIAQKFFLKPSVI